MRWVLRIFLGVGLLFLLSALGLFTADTLVEREFKLTYNHESQIPANRVGLVLGTSKYLRNGRPNLYYQYRIDAAVRLYKAGKIEYLLVSGDNSTKRYDEPTMMKEDLIAKGIPASRIYLDYAGFRTLDSVVRAKEIFGQSSFTVVSQQFHNERAIFLAKWFELDVVGFNAKDVGVRYGLKTKIRERFARVKMLIDLLLGTRPKFGGEPIQIG